MNNYYQDSIESVYIDLKSSSNGLSKNEAKNRLKINGPNLISKKRDIGIFFKFLSHFLNPLILILIFAAVLSYFIGESINAFLIFCIIIFGVTLNFIQEYSANNALKKLIDSIKTTTTIIRAGNKEEIRISDVVVGDVVYLSSGDTVPADARIIEAHDFFVNQSSITGESFPCEKTEAVSEKKDASISELSNIVFKGTNVVCGCATAIVIKTGKNTEFGKIAEKLALAPVKSDFEKGIGNLGIFLMKIILFIVIFIFLMNSLLKQDVFQSLLFATAIAVGVTPELLPMIMSVTMTVGSKKMAKKGVIIKKLCAIPNFGGMNILCTDKTGTLTENKIALVKYSDYKGTDNENVLLLAYINSSYHTGLKNPLDDAVIEYRKEDISKYEKIDEIPYDFVRKRMSVVAKQNKKNILITKGAPEEIFKCCGSIKKSGKIINLDAKLKEEAMKTYIELSAQGYRVLGIATKEVSLKKVYNIKEENKMIFEGFVSFLDPPKKDVKDIIKKLKEFGVETKIITGDNEIVTKKICEEVGLEIKGIVLGSDLEKITNDALKIKVERTTIFARCSPEQKNRIIVALRSNGNTVGYLGDGINDAPALKTADVGISVNSATDIAKESSDIIITKKSLRILNDGIIEGRKTFGNTMKYVMMAISSNFGNMFSAAGAILFLPFLPMLPIQILLNNLIYDVSQITIPYDNVDKAWIQKPKRWNLGFVKKFMYVFGPISSLFDYLTFIILFFVIKVSAPVFQTGWFLVSIGTQILVIHIIRTKNTPFLKSTASKWLIISTIICVIIGWLLPFTPIGPIFGFVPIPLHIMLVLGGIVLTYLITVELTKRLFYKKIEF